jgi:Acetoacetate decarboxylase (ADC)
MRVHARQLATGDVLEVNDWHLHIIVIEYEQAVTVLTAEVFTCPSIWVDPDASMLRGWIQGLPKKLGAVHVTRAFELPGAASTPTRAGTTSVATCTAAGERIAAATLTIERRARAAGVADHPHPRLINVRTLPRLEGRRHDEPALLLELVSTTQRDTIVSQPWHGAATLPTEQATGEDIALLRPIRVGTGRRYILTFTVDDLEVIEKLLAQSHTAAGNAELLRETGAR